MYNHPELLLAWEATYTREDQAAAILLFDKLASRARDFNDLMSEGALALHRAEAEIRRGRLDVADTLAEEC